ncbi:MAG: SDR family NAD(P)-dependent oxidoreductase [Clostridia bacterium]|nr:SDR family NAD(P)-dependent oxidoreductase [Clostridia bacterium]
MSNKDVLNRYILEGLKSGKFDKDMSVMILNEINKTKEEDKEDIAIVGLACKFPCADTPQKYWNNLKNGMEFIRSMPRERADDIGSKEDMHMKAGWLENIAMFDAGFFRISPKEAIAMHPSQRLFLETVWEAIEDSGYANNEIYGSEMGVYVGVDHTYQMEYNKLDDQQDLLKMTGSMTSVLASRISYILNLRGPNLIVDTACSSGLVATHLACKAIKNKECKMAISGGLHLIRQINESFDGVQSDDGKLSVFDKNSKGTVWGEGVAFLILKPLKEAIKDNDNIHAIIKGSAINNDGTTNGITAPSAETQSEVIVKAWEDAGIDPETISYMEAHATGTVLGDPIEVKGIKTAFEKYTDKKQFCGIGSVKANIGHGVGVAAVSSLMKVILSMKNKQIPININFTEPNPFIEFIDSPLYVNDTLKDWETGDIPLRAGISSFGFSRTNCHMVLEEAPEIKNSYEEETKNEMPYVFTLSARSEEALEAYIGKYNNFIKESNEFLLKDICFTGSTGRIHYKHRLTMILKDKEDFVKKIKKLSNSNFRDIDDKDILYGSHQVVSNNMKQGLPGEITKGQKREFDNMATDKLYKLADLEGQDYENSVKEICDIYIKGGDVDWSQLYKGKECRKISLPTYPFEHKHYWMEKEESEPQVEAFYKEIGHPLVDKCLVSTLNQEVYMTSMNVDRHWVLTEHLIMDFNVLPGTSYLEIAIEAGRKLCGNRDIELRDVIFLAPLVVDKDQHKEVHTIIKREDGFFSFTITSNSSNLINEENWIVHAEGKIYKSPEKPGENLDLRELRKRCSKYNLEIDMSSPMGEFKFGPRWRNVAGISVGENEALTEIKIHEEFEEDTKQFSLHPAMLDNAINLAIQKIVQKVEAGIYLPLSFKKLEVHKSLPKKFYSYQKINTRLDKGIKTVSLDIILINEEGEVLVEIQGYTIKKVAKEALRFGEDKSGSNQYHRIGWSQRDIQDLSEEVESGTVVVLKDERGIGDKVAKLLRNRGAEVIEVSYGNSFSKRDENNYEIGIDEASYINIIDELKGRKLSKIIHMGSICHEQVNSIEELEDRKNKGIYSLYYLTRALVGAKLNKGIDIVLVSDYVNEVTKDEAIINSHNASLAALGRVVESEYSGLKSRCIDIDIGTSPEEIVKEISLRETIYQVAYREDIRYVEEFTEYELEDEAVEEIDIKDEGVYLITGGTGGLGLEIAKHLGSINKVNIAMVSRSTIPDRAKWDMILETNEDEKLCSILKGIKEVERTGAKVVCYRGDITSFDDMKIVIDSLRTDFGRINGIIHSAGLAGQGIMIQKDMDTFKKVISPKIEGTWLLDRLTQEDELDFFVMFSSILSIIGAMGQSDYASANGYLDSFAAYRRKNGGRTATINWTVWKETGMALGYNIDEVRGLFKAVTNKGGIEAFDNILKRDITRMIVGELDYQRISHVEDGLNINLSPELKSKVEKRCGYIRANSKSNKKNKQVDVVIKGQESVSEIEMSVAQVWSEVLAMEEVSLYDSFIELGGDSIIAASLIKSMDKVFPDVLDISDIFTYPTIKLMSKYIKEKTDGEDNGALQQYAEGMESTATAIDSEAAVEEIMNRLAKGEISTEEADILIQEYSLSGK